MAKWQTINLTDFLEGIIICKMFQDWILSIYYSKTNAGLEKLNNH